MALQWDAEGGAQCPWPLLKTIREWKLHKDTLDRQKMVRVPNTDYYLPRRIISKLRTNLKNIEYTAKVDKIERTQFAQRYESLALLTMLQVSWDSPLRKGKLNLFLYQRDAKDRGWVKVGA